MYFRTMRSAAVILIFCCHTVFSQTTDYLKKAIMKSDVIHDGAHGILIQYAYDFSALRKTLKNDSILRLSQFAVEISFSKNNNPVKAQKEFSFLKDKSGNLVCN